MRALASKKMKMRDSDCFYNQIHAWKIKEDTLLHKGELGIVIILEKECRKMRRKLPSTTEWQQKREMRMDVVS